ncbi:MAG: hypothetical protein C4523_07075 [Myxococcales bacterium]|nr:MAG: hypothetical protein C4523_07075 [Myxococcales bacterium]
MATWMKGLAAVALMLLLCGTALAEEDKTVIVKGEGVIFQNDRALAKDRAIEAALRAAVEQVAGIYIQSSTLVQNYITVDDKILSQSKGFVKSWRELSSRVEDNVVAVEVEAVVAVAKLQGALNEIDWVLARKNYPRMMLLIAEQNIGQTGFSYWWGNTTSAISMGQAENTLIDALSVKGFNFVDPQVLAGKIEMRDAYKVTSGGISDLAARQIANLTDAQVVIVGAAVATEAGPVMEGSKLVSGQADVTVRAINTDNGQILMTASVHAAEAHISTATAGNKALIKAAKKLAEEIATKLTDKWMASVATITLDVTGLASYQQFDSLKNVLTHEIRGVKGVQERSMRQDKAQIDLFFDGKTSNLAKELTLKAFPGFGVKIDEVTANKIKLAVVKK